MLITHYFKNYLLNASLQKVYLLFLFKKYKLIEKSRSAYTHTQLTVLPVVYTVLKDFWLIEHNYFIYLFIFLDKVKDVRVKEIKNSGFLVKLNTWHKAYIHLD